MERISGERYEGKLEVGQRVYCALYGGSYGIITKIDGPQEPGSIQRLAGRAVVMGGRANMDVVFNDASEPHFSRSVPECIIRGVQWDIINPGVLASSEEIEAAFKAVKKAEAERKLAEAERARTREETRERIKQENPDLLRVTPEKYDRRVIGAKNLRKELSRAFPGVKFRVRGRSYSGGDAIDVNWEDGPTTAQVDEIIGKYQEGNFNSMIDLYEHDRDNVWPEIFGGAKYVHGQRSESGATILRAARAMGYQLTEADLRGKNRLEDPGIPLSFAQRQDIYREARKIDCLAMGANEEKGRGEINSFKKYFTKPLTESLQSAKIKN